MKLVEKEKARVLRKKGYSINQIVKEAGLTKSSVSLWVRDIVLTKVQKNKLSETKKHFFKKKKKKKVKKKKRKKIFKNFLLEGSPNFFLFQRVYFFVLW